MKKFISILMVICLSVGAFAQDNSADTKQSQAEAPDAVSSATKKLNVKVGVAAEVKDKNYVYTEGENTETHKQSFSRYRNKANAQVGALINFNDRVVINPYIRAHDMDFQTKNVKVHEQADESNDIIKTEQNFRFKSGALKIGASVSADVTDFFSMTCNIFQWDYFTENTPVWVGLGYSLALDFDIKQAFLSINFWDEISVRFNEHNDASNVHLLNLFDYGFRFNFFNFIDKRINTGLYASGEFELDYDAANGNYVNNYLYNEIYVGIKSSPLPFLDFWASFFVQAEADWNDDCSVKGNSGNIDLGLETGIGVKYNGFSANFSYEPHLYRLHDADVGDWNQSPIKQSISLTIGYKFKTYFTKK